MFPLLMAATPEAKMPREAKLPPYQSLVDTGATASAGGKQAVQDLCKSLVAVRPNLEVTVIETARPWFRFGNGRCGRALYKVTLKDSTTGVSMSIYALPAVGVPVLTGMKELQNLQCILNCTTGACVIRGRPMQLQKNHKEHLIIDYKEHIFPPSMDGPPHMKPNAVNPTSSLPTSSKPSRRVRFSEVEECHVLDIFTLDFFENDGTEIMAMEESDCFDFVLEASSCLASHLGVTETSLQHLTTTADTRELCPNPTPSLTSTNGRLLAQGRDPEGREGKWFKKRSHRPRSRPKRRSSPRPPRPKEKPKSRPSSTTPERLGWINAIPGRRTNSGRATGIIILTATAIASAAGRSAECAACALSTFLRQMHLLRRPMWICPRM